jgi:ribosomal protein S27AE
MRWPWQAREYARTCTNCGYTWQVPRAAARRRFRPVSMISVASPKSIDRGELVREISAISADNQLTNTYRQCPKCGSEQFEQHPQHAEPR